MSTRSLLSGLALATIVALPGLSIAQAHLPNFKRQLTPHKARLPRPSHALYNVHGRRLAIDQKDGRHQPRLLGKRDRHAARKSIRGVAHHVTAPHKH